MPHGVKRANLRVLLYEGQGVCLALMQYSLYRVYVSIKKMSAKAHDIGKFTAVTVVALLAAVTLACHMGPPKITIESPKAVLSPAIYGEAMVTMTIRNDGGPDVLKGVSADIAGAKASLHVMAGKRMTYVSTVDIRGGRSTVFNMGGSHIMIEDMPRTMVAGSPFTLTLVFEKAGVKLLHLNLEKFPAMPMNQHGD
jgi:copper(I)-binding protein